VQGRQTVDLSWTEATSSSIDIYRNGGRGHATYSYKVCEAGTGNCSNQVTVNF